MRRSRSSAAALLALGVALAAPAVGHAQIAGTAGALTLAPEGLAITVGGLAISDQAGNRVVRVSPRGETRVIAGTGAPDDFGGDGELAVTARLARPGGLAVLRDGRLAIADRANGRVRVVDRNGVISTLAGDGSNRADTTSANPTAIGDPFRIATLGDLLVFTTFRQLGVIRDGRAKLIRAPAQTLLAIAANASGQLFVSDGSTIFVRGSGDTYTPFAGGGPVTPGLGDGGPATQASFSTLADLAFGPDGSLYVVDTGNRRIRRIAPDRTVTTVAGGGTQAVPAQGQVPATALRLREPRAVVVASNGDLFIADRAGGAVIQVNATGMAARVAGCAGGLACDPLDINRTPRRGQSEFVAPVRGVGASPPGGYADVRAAHARAAAAGRQRVRHHPRCPGPQRRAVGQGLPDRAGVTRAVRGRSGATGGRTDGLAPQRKAGLRHSSRPYAQSIAAGEVFEGETPAPAPPCRDRGRPVQDLGAARERQRPRHRLADDQRVSNI